MNRDFAILGLREDATKEQVKQAYERQLHRYKAADYDDDPDYVSYKLEQVKSAYQRAYDIAGTTRAIMPEATSSRTETPSEGRAEDRYNRPTYKPREYGTDRKDYSDRDKEKQKSSLRLPDLNRLKDATKSASQGIKQTIAEKLDEFNRRDDVPETRRPAEVIEAAEPIESTKPRKTVESREAMEPREPIESASSQSQTTSTSSSDADKMMIAKVVIGIIVAVIFLVTQLGYDDTSYDYEDDYTSYGYEYVTDEDTRVYELTGEIRTMLYDSEPATEYMETEYEQADLEKVTAKFAKRYFDGKTLEEKGTELFETYGEFSSPGDSDIESLAREMLAFYDFPYSEDVIGYINKYNNETITNLVEYIRFLNQYYYYEVMEMKKGA